MSDPVAARVDWWRLSDQELERQCARDHYRASGPGGQKRNKTDSAVRLRHQPTGLVVTATESRSQIENRRRALRRLRASLAFSHRQPIDDDPSPLLRETCAGGRLELSTRDERYLPLAAYLLDLLEHHAGRLAEVAARIGVSTAHLVKFFRSSDDCWQAVQRIRKAHGQHTLH